MPRFAANLTTMFTERDLMLRFGDAARTGFRAVEYLFPYAHDLAALRDAVLKNGLTQVLFNAPAGDWEAGDRGLAALPGREVDFEASITRAFDAVSVIAPRCLHIMAGIGGDRATYIANLKHACAAAPEGLTIVIEPINTRDFPSYHLNTATDALTVLDAVGADNLKIEHDLYHAQIMEGDLANRLRTLLPHIGHIQIAGVPDRHEPDEGEVHYPYLFDLLDELGYEGFVGCEYRPRRRTEDGLGWFEKYKNG